MKICGVFLIFNAAVFQLIGIFGHSHRQTSRKRKLWRNFDDIHFNRPSNETNLIFRFEEFMNRYKKRYLTKDVAQKYETFKENFVVSSQINELSDYSYDKFLNTFGKVKVLRKNTTVIPFDGNVNISNENVCNVNNAVFAGKGCATAAIFIVVLHSIECNYALFEKTSVPKLNLQTFVDCAVESCEPDGVSITSVLSSALSLARFEPDTPEKPWRGCQGICDMNPIPVVFLRAVYKLPNDERIFAKILSTRGPIVTMISSSRKLHPYHYPDIIRAEDCISDVLDIAILVLSVEEAQGKRHYVAQAAFGADWGHDGKFLLEFGTNACGLLQEAHIPQPRPFVRWP